MSFALDRGFLGQHWSVWESWGADRWVVEVLRFGYCVPFLVTPPLSNVPFPLPSYSPSSIRGLALRAAVAELRAKGAIEPAPLSPGYYSRLFVTPKVTRGWRPVIDLSCLNRSVPVSHFHMETQQSVLHSLRPGDWMASLDLKDAYLQVPVHPESCCYLRFCVGEEVFQFRALCFGLSTAPQAFTRVMAPILSIMHRYGFRILRYLDDWLVLGSSFRDMVQARDFLLWLCQELGVQVNLEKSSLTPTQTLDYLGMRLQMLPLRVFPTPKCVLKLASLILEFTSCHLQLLALWRRLLGAMSSLLSIVPGSRLRMRSLQLRLNFARRLLPDSDSVSWDASCLEDLRWLSEVSHLLVGLPLGLSHSSLSLFTEASDSGWGASLSDDHMSDSWSLPCSHFSINHWELLVVFYGVQGFLPLLRHRSVSLFADNTTALTYLRNQGGTHSSLLNSVAQAILRLCEVHRVRLVPQFIPVRLNVLADTLSRRSQVLGSEWTLCFPAFQDLLLWPATIDLFATSLNHRLPVYFSPMEDLQSVGTDAMMQPWDGLQVYAFPPFGLFQRIIAKVRQSRGLELTLVAPFWPQHPWFPDLLELLVAVPVFLPRRKDLLRQPHFHCFHQNLPVFCLTAYHISSAPPAPSVSLRQWLDNLPAADAPPPE